MPEESAFSPPHPAIAQTRERAQPRYCHSERRSAPEESAFSTPRPALAQTRTLANAPGALSFRTAQYAGGICFFHAPPRNRPAPTFRECAPEALSFRTAQRAGGICFFHAPPRTRANSHPRKRPPGALSFRTAQHAGGICFFHATPRTRANPHPRKTPRPHCHSEDEQPASRASKLRPRGNHAPWRG